MDRLYFAQVWAGPALASGDPVRAFLVKPSDNVQQAGSSRSTEVMLSQQEQCIEIAQSASIDASASKEASGFIFTFNHIE